jgi:hypothetical protein
MTQAAVENKEALKAEKNKKAEQDAADEKRLNEGRSGKGTRVTLGYTRGRSTTRIQYEAFDETMPDTLPLTVAEFVELTKTPDEKTLVSYLIDGYNSAQYTAASDPIADFVNPVWDDAVKTQFRTVVRNYANATGVSIEDAVNLIKPGIEAAQAKAKQA